MLEQLWGVEVGSMEWGKENEGRGEDVDSWLENEEDDNADDDDGNEDNNDDHEEEDKDEVVE